MLFAGKSENLFPDVGPLITLMFANELGELAFHWIADGTKRPRSHFVYPFRCDLPSQRRSRSGKAKACRLQSANRFGHQFVFGRFGVSDVGDTEP